MLNFSSINKHASAASAVALKHTGGGGQASSQSSCCPKYVQPFPFLPLNAFLHQVSKTFYASVPLCISACSTSTLHTFSKNRKLHTTNALTKPAHPFARHAMSATEGITFPREGIWAPPCRRAAEVQGSRRSCCCMATSSRVACTAKPSTTRGRIGTKLGSETTSPLEGAVTMI